MKIIYAVKDTAVQAFGSIHLMRSQGEMIRSFQDEVNSTSGTSAIANHPEDYELYEIAHYDDLQGKIEVTEEHPILIARAKDLKIQRS